MSRNQWIAAPVLAVALVMTGTGAAIAQRSRVPGPGWNGDLTAAQFVEVRNRAGEVLLHGALTTTKDTAKETEREADLASPSGREGKGDIEIEIERKDGVVTENEIDLEVEKLPASLDCDVFLDGRLIGGFVKSKKGKGELELEWKGTHGR